MSTGGNEYLAVYDINNREFLTWSNLDPYNNYPYAVCEENYGYGYGNGFYDEPIYSLFPWTSYRDLYMTYYDSVDDKNYTVRIPRNVKKSEFCTEFINSLDPRIDGFVTYNSRPVMILVAFLFLSFLTISNIIPKKILNPMISYPVGFLIVYLAYFSLAGPKETALWSYALSMGARKLRAIDNGITLPDDRRSRRQ